MICYLIILLFVLFCSKSLIHMFCFVLFKHIYIHELNRQDKNIPWSLLEKTIILVGICKQQIQGTQFFNGL